MADDSEITASPPREALGRSYAMALVCCVLTTILSTLLIDSIDLANIVMLYLLTVLLVAVWQGKRAGVLAAVVSVLFFDVFFVPPRFSILVEDFQYVITFLVMLATALITGQLAAGLKEKVIEARHREQSVRALYGAATQLSAAINQDQVYAAAAGFVQDHFNAQCALLLTEDGGRTFTCMPTSHDYLANRQLATPCYTSREMVKNSSLSGNGLLSVYIPLQGAHARLGVFLVNGDLEEPESPVEMDEMLAGLTSLVAIALERLKFQEKAQRNEIEISGERLRNTILSALSHDLRTPLTGLVGLADALLISTPALQAQQAELATQISAQARKMSDLVANLLDLARASTGPNALNREWLSIEEVVGSSLRLLGLRLAGHPVASSMEQNPRLLCFDPVLIERVVCNLLENAVNHSPPGGQIDITVTTAGDCMVLAVRDRGKGFASEQNTPYGAAFTDKGQPRLGLLICNAIMSAHGGSLQIGNHPDGGALVSLSLPLGTPPEIEEAE